MVIDQVQSTDFTICSLLSFAALQYFCKDFCKYSVHGTFDLTDSVTLLVRRSVKLIKSWFQNLVSVRI